MAQINQNVGDLGLIPGVGRSLGEGNGYPLQYSGLENSMDYIVHWVAESQTRLSDFHRHTLIRKGQEMWIVIISTLFLFSLHKIKNFNKVSRRQEIDDN